MSFNPEDEITFTNKVTFRNDANEIYVDENGDPNVIPGMIRFKNDTFQGYHDNTDVDGENWRPLTQNIATTTSYGVIKVGENLLMNENTGYLSSLSSGDSRFNQLVITISKQPEGGDFSSIVYAISNAIGTVEGGYTNGSLTQASALNAAPNVSNSFILLVSPGIYEEPGQIVLPDFVSIKGEGINQCIIKQANSQNLSLSNSSIIKSGSNCTVSDISLQLHANNTSNICGIYANNKSDILIDNVKIEEFGTDGATSNTVGIYVQSGTNNLINDCELNFTLNSNDIYGLHIINTNPEIKNSKIIIDTSTNNNNYGIYLSNSYIDEKQTLITSCELEVSGSLLNNAIYLSNSTSRIEYSSIKSIDETTSTHNSYGISLRSEDSVTTSTSTGIVSFTHNSNSRDTINSSDTNEVNFLTLGFTKGQSINITGAATSSNNGYFTIFNVSSSSLTLIEQDILETEAAGNTITIKELYNVDISYSQINGTTNSIKSQDSNGNYQVNLNYTNIEGGDLDLGNDNILFTNKNLITVSKKGGDYELLSSALESIIHNTSNNRYLIKIMPGLYIEQNPITLKQYVSVIGSGKENTIIKFDNTNATLSDGGGITLIDNVELMHLTIQNITTGSNTNKSFGIYGLGTSSVNKLSNLMLNDLKIESLGVATTQYGIYMKYCDYKSDKIDISVSGTSSGSAINYGWYQEECVSINQHTDIILTNGSASAKNVGYYLKKSNIDFHSSNVFVSGSSNINLGLETEEENSDNNKIQIYNGQITAIGGSTTNSIKNGSIATNYICVVNNVRFDGDIDDNSINSRNVICNDCYEISEVNVFKPLSIRGQREQNDNNSLTIGYTSGKINMTGDYNTFVGVESGEKITSGNYNTFMGTYSGKNNTSGSENTLLGYSAGRDITDGINNVCIGSNAGMSLTSAVNNIHIGRGSGYVNTIGNHNVSIGSNSSQSLTSGDMNVTIGHQSGFNLTNSDNNVMIGTQSGYNTTTSSNVTMVGYQSGYNSTNSSNVVLIGSKSGYNNAAIENTMIGFESGYNNTTGEENTIIGYRSSYYNVSGKSNTLLGKRAGEGSSGGSNNASYNVIVGNEAGRKIDSGENNVLIGSKTVSGSDAAGWSITSGSDNIAIGNQSGKSMTSAENNILIGKGSGSSITTSGYNIIVGKDSGSSLTSGEGNNIMIGSCAGVNVTKGNNLLIGNEAGKLNSSSEAICLGNQAGYYNSGDRNTFIGFQSGGLTSVETTGSDNLCIGLQTGYNLTTGSRNVIMGGGNTSVSTGRQINTGSDNTIIGFRAGGGLRQGDENILLGSNAGGILTGNKNIAIGHKSSESTQGDGNINIGHESGKNQTTAEKNISIGYQTAYNTTEGDYNLNLGYQSGYSGITNNYNVHIGYQSGFNSIADNNILVGYKSGYEINHADGKNNVFMGYESGLENTQGSTNINIGYQAGKNNQTGVKNVMIGDQAGVGSTTYSASKNILIGANAGKNNQGSKNIYIGISDNDASGVGYQSTSNSEKNVYIGSNCGVNNLDGKFNVAIGAGTLESIENGENNIGIGKSTGKNLTDGIDNILLGVSSGSTLVTGSENISIGKNAGRNIGSNVNDNILIGENAGENVTTSNIIAIGTNSGKENTSGLNNIYIGEDAGRLNQTVDNNIIVGPNSGESLVSGKGDNIFIGKDTAKNVTSGDSNIVFGTGALENGNSSNCIVMGKDSGKNNTGNNNTAIGTESLFTNISGEDNICIGYQSGYNLNTSNCILFGKQSGYNITTGDNNISFGTESLYNNTVGSNNIIMGYQSLYNNISGENNISFGFQTLYNSTVSSNNFVVGYRAGYNFNNTNTNSELNGNNVFIGFNAGRYNQGYNNCFMGDSVGKGSSVNFTNNTANNCIAIGDRALTSVTTGSNNVVLGNDAALYLRTGENNIIMGYRAAETSRSISNSICLGYQTNLGESGGINNIHIGYRAGAKLDKNLQQNAGEKVDGAYTVNSHNNISMGDNSMIGDNFGGGDGHFELNTIFGYNALNNVETGKAGKFCKHAIMKNTMVGFNSGNYCAGSNNTVIGSSAGSKMYSANNNVYIGYSSGYNNPLGSNNIFIANSNTPSNLSVSVNDTFAVYKDNGLETGTNPLLFGNLSNGALAINSRTFLSNASISESDTKLFVNGAINAYGYTPFTGLHNVIIENNELVNEGEIMSSTGSVKKDNIVNTIVTVSKTTIEIDKTVFGVYAGFEMGKYEDTTNKFIYSNILYGKKNLGFEQSLDPEIYSQYGPEDIEINNDKDVIVTEKIENENNIDEYFETFYRNELILNPNYSNTAVDVKIHKVASVGEGSILITNINGEVQNGDYITSSNISGYGMKQNDDLVHNYTVAKCTQDINWSSINEYTTHDGNDYKIYNSSCTYHCG